MSNNTIRTLFNLIIATILSLSVLLSGAYAQQWRSGTGMTAAGYQKSFDSLSRSGYVLENIDGFSIGKNTYYSAVWQKRKSPVWLSKHGLTSAQYQAEFNKLTKAGYRPRRVNAYNIAGGLDRYAAIWEKSSGPAWYARHNLDVKAHQTAFDTYVKQGYRLKQVSGYTVNGAIRYASLYEKSAGPAWVSRHGIRADTFNTEVNNRLKQGYKPISIDAFTVGNIHYFGAIWEKSAGGWNLYYDMSAEGFRKRHETFVAQGYHLVSSNGYGTTKPLYAAIWHK